MIDLVRGYTFPIIMYIIVAIGAFMVYQALKPQDIDRIVKSSLPVFEGTHYDITYGKYEFYRHLIFAICLILSYTLKLDYLGIVAIILYGVFYPKEGIRPRRVLTIGGEERTEYLIEMPFSTIKRRVKERDKALKDDELMEVLSVLKNLIIQLKKTALGADYVIEFVSSSSRLTRTAFIKFLLNFRRADVGKAEKEFINEIGTPLSMEVARLLVSLDVALPEDLEQTLLSIQNEVRQSHLTKKQGRAGFYSDLVFVPILLTALIIMINFIQVVYRDDLMMLMNFAAFTN